MTKTQKTTLATLRAYLGVKRLRPSSLFRVSDGNTRWIGSRKDLTEELAQILNEANGAKPWTNSNTDSEIAAYDRACNEVRCLAGNDGSGQVRLQDLPENWQDGSALGEISPL